MEVRSWFRGSFKSSGSQKGVKFSGYLILETWEKGLLLGSVLDQIRTELYFWGNWALFKKRSCSIWWDLVSTLFHQKIPSDFCKVCKFFLFLSFILYNCVFQWADEHCDLSLRWPINYVACRLATLFPKKQHRVAPKVRSSFIHSQSLTLATCCLDKKRARQF